MEGRERLPTERERAWELRCNGMSYPTIAKTMGVSLGKAWNLVQRTEKEAHRQLADAAVQTKSEHLGQLERLKEAAFFAFLNQGLKPQYAAVVLKAMELERKTVGLDKAKSPDEGVELADIFNEIMERKRQREALEGECS